MVVVITVPSKSKLTKHTTTPARGLPPAGERAGELNAGGIGRSRHRSIPFTRINSSKTVDKKI
eukprot:10545340-Prorocentrum_lima.AAC.1